jgi:hypothetical protein
MVFDSAVFTLILAPLLAYGISALLFLSIGHLITVNKIRATKEV